MASSVSTSPDSRVRAIGTDEPTVCAAFALIAATYPERVALRTLDDGVSITWGEYAERVRGLAAGLHALGLRHGDSLACMLSNRPEFHLADAAGMHLGAVCFSVYNTSTVEQIEYVLANAATRIVVCEQAFLERIEAVRDRAESPIEHIVLVDGHAPGTLSLSELEGLGDPQFDFDASWRAVGPEDLLCLIYTSGTTGPPKGVQLTHANFMAQSRVLRDTVGLYQGTAVSGLPMAHVAERNSTHYFPMTTGHTVTCCPDPREVFAHAAQVHPTAFFAVPRMWEKLKSALEAAWAVEADPAKRDAVAGALDVGLRRVRAEQAGEAVGEELEAQHRRADELVLSPIRERIGLDRCDYLIVGAAPTPYEVLEFFHALGLPINEVWGMSENCAVATVSPPDAIRIGTVGKPAPGVEVLRADDGELLIRGPIVMVGYRNEPDKTAEALDSDGWLHTGDIGEFDGDGYLRIVDRKKELIISAGGKNMSPANIEARLKTSSPLIGQAIAIGDGRPYNVALLVLDPDAAGSFAAERGLAGRTPAELAGEEAVLAEVADGVARANAHLSRVEQIKRFALLDCDWEPGGDELTPTMKLKRKPIMAKYAGRIEGLYG
jgi:long-subunit acyl-CoA synthetase (AMP-forming)